MIRHVANKSTIEPDYVKMPDLEVKLKPDMSEKILYVCAQV